MEDKIVIACDCLPEAAIVIPHGVNLISVLNQLALLRESHLILFSCAILSRDTLFDLALESADRVMGDNGHSAGTDEELTLPRATVAKLINGGTHLLSL